jgi:hypothetical protein
MKPYVAAHAAEKRSLARVLPGEVRWLSRNGGHRPAIAVCLGDGRGLCGGELMGDLNNDYWRAIGFRGKRVLGWRP